MTIIIRFEHMLKLLHRIITVSSFLKRDLLASAAYWCFIWGKTALC